MVTIEIEALRSGRLPVYGQQRSQIILVCHAREPGEEIFQISQGLLAVTLTGHDQGIEDRRTRFPRINSDAGSSDKALAHPQELHLARPAVRVDSSPPALIVVRVMPRLGAA